MKPGMFKSATALAMIVSLMAPMPGFAEGQAKGKAEVDLGQMSQDEIAALVDRCRERAERQARRESKGKEIPAPDGRIAEFCASYGDGVFDAMLPDTLQSDTVLADLSTEFEPVADLAQPPENSGDTTGAKQERVPSNTEGAQQSASPAVKANSPADEAEGKPSAETAAGELEKSDAVAADSETIQQPPADTTAADERKSHEQADALAQTEGEASAVAATANGETEAEAEVIEETVTEDTTRSSDEEFDTKPDAAVAAQAPARQDDGDSGLSKLEKAALLGLGALAVGNLLNSGETVVSNSGDRAVVEQNGQYRVIKNDDALLRQPGSNVKTYQFGDGSTRTVVTREDGSEVETIRASDGRVLRRSKTLTDGRTVLLFDDTRQAEKVVVDDLPATALPRNALSTGGAISAENLAAALTARQQVDPGRRFSLAQVRGIDAVRRLVPEINVDNVTFDTGSSAIRPAQAEELAALGNALRGMVDRNPAEVFLIEGHTDAVGGAAYNLALSDRRAESVALALTEYFDVPPENMVVQGYGEDDLVVPVLVAERANRRVAVRRVTPLLTSDQ